MRLILTLMACVLLMSLVSATDLSFAVMFPECVNQTNDMASTVRCGAYFLTPNFHFPVLWNLVIYGFFDSVYKAGEVVFNGVTNLLIPSSAMYDDIQTLNYSGVLTRITDFILIPLVAPVTLLYGIFSSIFVYLLLLTWEFVKTYLIIATSWALWSTVIFKELKGGSFLTNPFGMAVIIIGIMVGGSIALLSLDITVWGVL